MIIASTSFMLLLAPLASEEGRAEAGLPASEVLSLFPNGDTSEITADLVELKASPETRRVLAKLERSVRANRRQYVALAAKQKPGEPLPYRSWMGISKAQYDQFVARDPAESFVPTKAGELTVRFEDVPSESGLEPGRRVTIESLPLDSVEEGLKIDLQFDVDATGEEAEIRLVDFEVKLGPFERVSSGVSKGGAFGPMQWRKWEMAWKPDWLGELEAPTGAKATRYTAELLALRNKEELTWVSGNLTIGLIDADAAENAGRVLLDIKSQHIGSGGQLPIEAILVFDRPAD